MRRVTVKEMKEHLGRLAAATGATIETWQPPPETTARTVLGNPPRVLMPEVRSRREYFAGLHEFGHVVLGHRSSGSLGESFLQEVQAWLWAFENSEQQPTPAILSLANCLLWQRLDDYNRLRGSAGRPASSAVNFVPEWARGDFPKLAERLIAATGECKSGQHVFRPLLDTGQEPTSSPPPRQAGSSPSRSHGRRAS